MQRVMIAVGVIYSSLKTGFQRLVMTPNGKCELSVFRVGTERIDSRYSQMLHRYSLVFTVLFE